MRSQVKRGVVDLDIRLFNVQSIYITRDQLFLNFKMANIEGDVTKQITSDVELFGSIMQQNGFENHFNRNDA